MMIKMKFQAKVTVYDASMSVIDKLHDIQLIIESDGTGKHLIRFFDYIPIRTDAD